MEIYENTVELLVAVYARSIAHDSTLDWSIEKYNDLIGTLENTLNYSGSLYPNHISVLFTLLRCVASYVGEYNSYRIDKLEALLRQRKPIELPYELKTSAINDMFYKR